MSGSTAPHPPYRVPGMAEIRALPWNGYRVVSTFSGGGGSCLGYRMAGFRVVWANEFIPAARETYRANAPETILDGRNIREVKPEEILEATGIERGGIDLFDGSPPCASFSTAGARDKYWGRAKAYSDTRERTDDLFFEYARLLRGLQPRTFVAENVSGLVKGTAKGYFKLILSELKACGYRVSARLLNAAWLGVPQERERLIFVGVRNDLCERFGVAPAHPKPGAFAYTLGEAFEGLRNDPREVAALLADGARYAWGRLLRRMPKNPPRRIGGDEFAGGSYFNLVRQSFAWPASTILQTHGNPSTAGTVHPSEDRKFTIAELRRIMSVPDDFVLTGTPAQQWERLGRMVPPVMMARIAATVRDEILERCREETA